MSDDTLNITADDNAPAMYAYGRPYAKGEQQAAILFAKADKWPNSNDKFVEVTFGVACPRGSDCEGLGCKIDRRFSIPSDDWRAWLSIIEPAALNVQKGANYSINFSAWKGKYVTIGVIEEKDKKRSAEAGMDVFRPRVGSFKAAPAPAAQKGGPL